MATSAHVQPTFEGMGGKALRTLARRVAAYVPVTVTRQILQTGLPQPGEPRWLQAATMFTDMSGFTRMAEALAADGPRGAEELNRTLLMTFTALINVIHDAGGAVCHFHGDGMMVYFPDEDGNAARRALASARFMQGLMSTSFAQVRARRPDGDAAQFTLTIKIGVGYGRCLETIVGDPQTGLEFVLAGTAVDEAVAAQAQAEAGEVVASRAAAAAAGLAVEDDFYLVEAVTPVPSAQQSIYWEAFEPEALSQLLLVAPAFIPHVLFERLKDRNTQFVAEHRPATSMFVQFEGIDFGTEAAGEQLQAYYLWACQIVAQYGGQNSRVNRILVGDKGNLLHIIFGAPMAPDAPDQAVRCALALQQERPHFITRQRIGLAAGRVFACAVGSKNRREYTIVGSVVNLSARLVQICPDRFVLTDEATARRVQDRFQFEAQPPVTLKGHETAITLYRPLSETVPQRKSQPHFALSPAAPGLRDEEFARLKQVMDAALAGEGGLTAVCGAFGSGKLSFVQAGISYWQQNGGRSLSGLCQQHTADVPFAPWQAIWRDLLGLTANMSAAMQVRQIAEQVDKVAPDFEQGVWLWAGALGLAVPETDRFPPLTVETKRARFLAMIQRCLATAAHEQPLLIVLEDIHWADQSSLDLIDVLVTESFHSPILLLVTYQDGAHFAFHTAKRPHTTQITLDDFSPQRARQLVKARLGTDELPMVVEQRLGLRDRQGRASPVNPTFLQESLKMMLADGVIRVGTAPYENGRIRVDEARLAEMPMPDSIYTILLTRFDQLPAAGRSLLQSAAVIGREFSLSTLVSVTPELDRAVVVALLDELIQDGMIVPAASEPEPAYTFQHALLHDVVYQSMPYARRQALHVTIAELLAARHQDNLKPILPVLAYHYSYTDQHAEGLKYTLAAADDAAAIFANRGAADLYKQAATHLEALGVEANWETAVTIYVRRARVLRLMGKLTQATLMAADALKLCLVNGNLTQTLPIYNLLAEIRYAQARFREALSLTEQVIHSLVRYTPPAELAQAYYLSGLAAGALFKNEAALDRLERAEEIYQVIDRPQALAAVLAAKGEISGRVGQMERAGQLLSKAVTLARQDAAPIRLSLVLYHQSRVLLRHGQPKAALAAAHEAVAKVRSASHNFLAHVLIQRAAVYVYMDDLPAAESDLRLADELLETMDDVLGTLQLHMLWGFEYCRSLPDWSQARPHLAQVGQIIASQPKDDGIDLQEDVRLWLGLGWVALQTKHWQQAASLLDKALAAADARALNWWRPAIFYALGMLSLAQAPATETAVAEARRYFQTALKAVQAGGNPDELPLILLQLALLMDPANPQEKKRQEQYLEACIVAARKRARYGDRRACFQEAGQRLLHAHSERLRRIGAGCLAWLDASSS